VIEPKSAPAEVAADEQVDLLFALLGEDEAAAAFADAVEAPVDGAAEKFEAYASMGKKEMRARVKKLAAERPEFLARIITHWLKEERLKGR
jgi:flagellar biosynthesis/type III secretory pathway M-ring protein FliF/YscJ